MSVLSTVVQLRRVHRDGRRRSAMLESMAEEKEAKANKPRTGTLVESDRFAFSGSPGRWVDYLKGMNIPSLGIGDSG